MIPIAIVGVGKIARDQHIPTIAASPSFRLAGVVSQHAKDLDVPAFATLTELKQALPEVAAIAVCTPPRGRRALIEEAFALGLDVMIEKPPAATLSEAESFADLARAAGRTLHVTWHSREAAAVEPARHWLAGKTVRATRIDWLEDVRVWHPGQEWIWEPGIGVFDPGVNALSIATALLPGPLTVADATLAISHGRAAPIEVKLDMTDATGAPVAAHFSFDQRGPQTWTMTLDTDAGALTLTDGGAHWSVDGVAQPVADDPEYARLYRRFAELIAARAIDADLSPFRLVADAHLLGRRTAAPAFSWSG